MTAWARTSAILERANATPAAWLAGINRMPWPAFLLWNALGGVAWASGVGIASYLAGVVVQRIAADVGLVAQALLIVAIGADVVVRRLRSAQSG